jgi:fermentation-respiration switch protein FrsA (DUF1100 family)
LRNLILDCPFGDLPAILDRQLTRHSGLPAAFNPGILFAAGAAFGSWTADLVPARSAHRLADRRILLIQGEEDHLVPAEQARRIRDAAGSGCRLVELPDVGHNEGYRERRHLYMREVVEFLRSAFPEG